MTTENKIDLYRQLAKDGNTDAQVNLGICYMKGMGVEQDNKKAFNLFKTAAAQRQRGALLPAEQGNVYAQSNLGICYRKGLGVQQDFNQAFKWYKKAAEQN